MRAYARLLGSLLSPLLVACSGPPPAPAEPAEPATVEPAAEEAPSKPPPPLAEADDARVELRGTIVFRPVESGRKSVEAYLGDELFLTTEDGRELALQPSDAVTKDALVALAGKRVVIKAEESEGTLPDPHESYPTGANGEPLRRGAGFRVLELRESK